MKQITIFLLSFLMVGCFTFESIMKDQVNRYGLDSDPVKVLVAKGAPTFYFYEQDNPACKVIKYDQILTYIKTTPNHGGLLSVYNRTKTTSKYYFLNGEFVKIND